MMTAAVASQHDDEPHADPAEAEMSEAAFAVIGRARELCGHPAAVELEQREDCLITHAVKIMCAQIRAAALVAEMKERGEFEDVGVICPVDGDDDGDDGMDVVITDTPGAVDWKEVAQAAWRSEGWAAAAVYHKRRYAWVRR